MAAYSYDQNSSLGQGFGGVGKVCDPFSGGFNGANLHGGSVHQSLVLDSERGKLVKAPGKVGKREVSEAKAMAALKNHCEAERRRRERINAHLDSLRGLVPCNLKMDKATLLAEVITRVKELQKNAIEASKGLLIPMDSDEVKVEPYGDSEAGDTNFAYKASICCEYRPEIMSDLRQALDSLPLKMIKAEISTLGSRLTNVFVFSSCKEGVINNAEASRILANAVHQALNSVMEKASPSLLEYLPRRTPPIKRQRIYFDSSSSSS